MSLQLTFPFNYLMIQACLGYINDKLFRTSISFVLVLLHAAANDTESQITAFYASPLPGMTSEALCL